MRMGSFFTTGMLPGLIRSGRVVTVGGAVSALPPNKVIAGNLSVAELLGGFIRLTPTGAMTLQLPAAAGFLSYLPDLRLGDRIYCIFANESAGANTVTIGAAGVGLNFQPTATPTLTQGQVKTLYMLVTAIRPSPLVACYI